MMEVFHIITSSNGEEVKHMTKFMKSLGIGALALTMLVGCQTKQPTDNKVSKSQGKEDTICIDKSFVNNHQVTLHPIAAIEDIKMTDAVLKKDELQAKLVIKIPEMIEAWNEYRIFKDEYRFTISVKDGEETVSYTGEEVYSVQLFEENTTVKIKEKITETAVLTYLHTKSDAKSSYVTISLNFLNENGDVVHVYNIVSPKNEIKVYE